MAAVLACGADAVLSHRAAAKLWELRASSGTKGIDVTVPGRRRHGHNGIVVHNVRSFDPRDRTVLDGIPVTSLHRTLLDYAEVSQRRQLRGAFEAADRRERLDFRALKDQIARGSGRRGVNPLKALANEYRGPPDVRSGLETQFLELIRDTPIPDPQVNVVVAGHVVDFFWPNERLVVEVDSYRYHRSREAFEHDRIVDMELRLAHVEVLRITDRRMKRAPHAVRGDVLTMLSAAQRAAASGP
jgi:very-short-patch-repair endonuclease